MKQCKLCGNEFEKLCKAHIIPDFMYRELGLFNDQHRVQTIRMVYGKVITGHRPTGEYDTEILCKSCDGDVIGKYEKYAQNTLFAIDKPTGISLKRQVNAEGSRSFLIQNVDYRQFKLFLLSVLWRASITQSEFFKEVKLDSSDENRIRDMLNNDDPGTQLDYPCVVWTHIKLDLPKDYILSPLCQHKPEFTAYYFPIGGSVFMFFTGKVEAVPLVGELALNEQGVTRWPEFKDARQVEQLIGMRINP